MLKDLAAAAPPSLNPTNHPPMLEISRALRLIPLRGTQPRSKINP
jgi:hypothetical protein